MVSKLEKPTRKVWYQVQKFLQTGEPKQIQQLCYQKKKKKHIVLYYCHLCNTDFLLEPILYYLFFNKICKQQCNGA